MSTICITTTQAAYRWNVDVQGLFETFGIDYVGPIEPVSLKGNRYILLAIEYYTKWPLAQAVSSADAITSARFIYEQIFCTFGPSKALLTDNGSHFDNAIFQVFVDMANSKHKLASPYHPQTSGKVEHLNGTLVKALRKLTYSYPQTWDERLPTVLYAYRTKVRSKLKQTPYERLHGWSPRSHQSDILQQVGLQLG